MAEKIRDIMSKNVVALDAGAKPREAARAMREHGIGAVIVERGQRVCGIVTDRDLVGRGLGTDEGLDRELSNFCSQELVSVGPNEDVEEVLRLMKRKMIRRIPVLDDGRAVGIVSIGDLAKNRNRESVLGQISAAPERLNGGGSVPSVGEIYLDP